MCEHVLCLLVGCVGGWGLELLLPFTSPLKKLGQSFLWRIQQRCFWQCGDVGGREGAVASRNVVRRAEEGLVGQLLYTVQPIQASGFHHCDAIPSMHNCQPQSFPLSLALEEGKKNMGSRSPRVWDQGLFSSWGSFSWVKMKGCSPFHSSLPLFFSAFVLFRLHFASGEYQKWILEWSIFSLLHVSFLFFPVVWCTYMHWLDTVTGLHQELLVCCVWLVHICAHSAREKNLNAILEVLPLECCFINTHW